MANNTTIGFTLKVNGVDQTVNSINDLDASIIQLEDTLKGATFGSEAFKKIQDELVKAKTAKEDLDKSLEGRGAEKRLQGIVGIAESLGGAFAIASQASALFGKENEAVAKAELKAQQAISVVLGIRAIKEGLLNSALERKIILEKAATAGTVILNAVNKALNITLSLNPIGLVVTALGLLVIGVLAAIDPIKKLISQFDFLGDAVTAVVDTFRNVASFLTGGLIDDAATSKTRSNAEAVIKSLDDVGSASNKLLADEKRRLAFMQASGATEAQILAQKKKINQQEVASRQAAVNELIKLQKIDGELSEEKQKQLVELQEAIKDLNNQAAIDQADFDKKQKEEETKRIEERKKAQDDFVKEYLAKIAEANKKTRELEQRALLNSIDDEEEKAKKTLEIQQQLQKDELQLAIDTINKKKNLSNQELAFRDSLMKQMTALEKVQAQETEKLIEDLNEKRKAAETTFAKELETIKNQTHLEGISNARVRAEEEARLQLEIALRDIEQSQRSETQKQELIAAIKDQFDLKEKIRKQENRQADLDLQIAQNEEDAMSNLTTFEEKLAILDENNAIINQRIFASEDEKTAALKKNADLRAAIEMAELEHKAEIANAVMGLAAQAGQFLQQIAGENKALAIAGIVIEKAAAIGAIIANTSIANAKAIAASPLTAGQPFVGINTASGILAGASTIAAAAKAISEINSAGSEAGGSAATAAPSPSRFAVGGMVTGPGTGTSDSIPALLSNGEVVINANSAAMFGSLLSQINQAGGGAPIQSAPQDISDKQMIIKTYDISGEWCTYLCVF